MLLVRGPRRLQNRYGFTRRWLTGCAAEALTNASVLNARQCAFIRIEHDVAAVQKIIRAGEVEWKAGLEGIETRGFPSADQPVGNRIQVIQELAGAPER